MQFLSSLSGLPISAQSAAYAPTNSADVSAIASAYAESAASAAYQSATAGGGGGGGGGTAYVPLSATEVAIGSYISALPSNSFAQGIYSRANQNAFVQGESNTAYYDSFAQGRNNSASYGSFAQGLGNRAADYAAVFGKYNIYNDNDEAQSSIALAYGDGSAGNRHNLFEFRKNGTLTLFSGTNDTAGFEVRSAIESKQNTLTFGYDSGAISSINGSAIAGGSGGGGGGGGSVGDKFAYHAPAHSIIFLFNESNYNPSVSLPIQNATWTQLSVDSNIWKFDCAGSWASMFYDSSTNTSKILGTFEILSINFYGVTSAASFMKNAPVTRIHEVVGEVTCDVSSAFMNTTWLLGNVAIPSIHTSSCVDMFKNSTLESITIDSMWGEFYPGWEGDPEMGDPGMPDWYGCTTCTGMFDGCHHLYDVNISIAYVRNCARMFRYCHKIVTLPSMQSWVFGDGDYSYMFDSCQSLIYVGDLSFNHESYQGSSMNPDNPEYDKMGNAVGMFRNCYSLQRTPYFTGYLGDCYSTESMFYNCLSLISISWDKLIDLGHAYLTDYDPDTGTPVTYDEYRVSNVSNMFYNCRNLIHGAVAVYQGMLTYWPSIQNHSYTFLNCGQDVGSTELASIPRSWGGTQS